MPITKSFRSDLWQKANQIIKVNLVKLCANAYKSVLFIVGGNTRFLLLIQPPAWVTVRISYLVPNSTFGPKRVWRKSTICGISKNLLAPFFRFP